jgi:hypothetical protein
VFIILGIRESNHNDPQVQDTFKQMERGTSGVLRYQMQGGVGTL